MSDYLRPPGAVPETVFTLSCIRCARCVEVCPYKTIRLGTARDGFNAGTPMIEARTIPCYLCMRCPEACPSGALEVVAMREVRMGRARIREGACLPFLGVLCRTCYNACPIFDEAITMNELLQPLVDERTCTGCGICEHVCPTDPPAIVVERTP